MTPSTNATRTRPPAPSLAPFSAAANGTPESVVIKPGDMYGRVEIVTCAQMQRYLDEANTGTAELAQRKLSNAVINDFVSIINTGGWQPVPPGLIFGTDGTLLNGAQRGAAQVRVGRDLPWFVIRNCPLSLFALLDNEKKRTLADLLGMMRVLKDADLPSKVTPHLASALRLMNFYESALRPDAELGLDQWSRWYGQRRQPYQLLETLERHPKMLESLTVGFRLHTTAKFSGPAVTVWHRLTLDAHPKAEPQAAEFIHQVNLGQHITQGDPAYALRRWHERGGPASHNADHHRCTRERYLFALMQAWNAYAQRKELAHIGVSGRQPMPTPENVRAAARREGASRA